MEQSRSVAFEHCHQIAFLGFAAALRGFVAALHPNAISSAAALHPSIDFGVPTGQAIPGHADQGRPQAPFLGHARRDGAEWQPGVGAAS